MDARQHPRKGCRRARGHPTEPSWRPTTWRCSTSTGSSTSAATPSTGADAHRPGRGRGTARRLRHQQRLAPAGRRWRASWSRLGVAAERRRRRHLGAGRGARVLADRFGAGARSLLLGGAGLEAALREAGLEPVGRRRRAWRVATGYGPDVRWRDIMRAAALVRDGLPWVASNTDLTIPTAVRHGARATACWCDDARGLRRRRGRRWPASRSGRCWTRPCAAVGGDRPLMVGDRLDTDIEGAHAIGIASLLVLTGVTWLAELVAAGAASCGRRTSRPTSRGSSSRTRRRTRARRGRRLGGWRGDGRRTGDSQRRRVTARTPTGGGSVAAAAGAHLDDDGDVVGRRPTRRRPDAGRRLGAE